jgi:hypothetical protein
MFLARNNVSQLENVLSFFQQLLIRFPGAPSSAPSGLSFYNEMIPKLPLMSESGMLQGSAHLNLFRNVMQEQLQEKEFREHVSQVCLQSRNI